MKWVKKTWPSQSLTVRPWEVTQKPNFGKANVFQSHFKGFPLTEKNFGGSFRVPPSSPFKWAGYLWGWNIWGVTFQPAACWVWYSWGVAIVKVLGMPNFRGLGVETATIVGNVAQALGFVGGRVFVFFASESARFWEQVPFKGHFFVDWNCNSWIINWIQDLKIEKGGFTPQKKGLETNSYCWWVQKSQGQPPAPGMVIITPL